MTSLRATVPQVPLDLAWLDARPDTLDFSRVLFLDIDGVLHPEMPTELPRFCYLANLADCLRRVDPDARVPVVISSDWKLYYPLSDLRTQLSPDIARQVVGVTPDHFGWPDRNRQSEIADWMAQHAPDGAWLAIDDRAHWFDTGCRQLFHVAGVRDGGPGGLDAASCRQLEGRLREFLAAEGGKA